MGSQIKKSKISYINANVTSIISVTLVLALLGMGALLGLFAHSATERLQASIGFDVSMADDATDSQVLAMKRLLSAAPYTASVKYISKEEALLYWQRETGEDLMQVLGFNPLTAEFEVHVKPQYAVIDSLSVIEATLSRFPSVDTVQVHRDQVEALNNNINSIMAVLAGVALALLVVSFALINNTVRLTVYSRRFLIYTMKLVGATPGFIRRPIVVSNIINGIIAALAATALLSAALFYIEKAEGGWSALVSMGEVWCVFGALVAVGAVLCGIGALMASNKYLRLDYDELFKR